MLMMFCCPPVSTQDPCTARGVTVVEAALGGSLKISLLYCRPSAVAERNSVLHGPLSLPNERSLRDH